MQFNPQLCNPNLHSADRIQAFVNEIAQVYLLDRPQDYVADRRADERMKVTIPVGISVLDEKLVNQSQQFHAITRDISHSGIGMVMTSPVRVDEKVLLTIEPFHNQAFKVIATVRYCNGVGYYFQVGCEFMHP